MRHLVGRLPMLFASAAGAQEDFTIACDSLSGSLLAFSPGGGS